MYQLFQVDGESGMFTLVHQSENFAEYADRKSALPTEKSVIFFDFAKSTGLTEQEETRIILDLMEKSDGEITRVTKGVTVSKNEDAICCGSGSCFCVVANGTRYCETYYCYPNGYCWAVRCNIPCGC
jgi:hypothetical protein